MTLAWRLALREMRGGLGGLRLLAVCLFLGVAAISGVGSLSSAILSSLASEGRVILGGDAAVEIAQRRATPEELDTFRDAGTVVEILQMRANASTADNAETVIGELKAVGSGYPLYGEFTLQGGGDFQEALSRGVLLGREGASRLGLRVGDAVRVGGARLPLTGILDQEPDKVAEGFVLGPTILMSKADFARTGLERPGTLFESEYRIRMPASADLEAFEEDLLERFPDAGFDVDTRENAAPGARRFILNTGQFLTMVGLTALLVAGVGVGSGVTSYLRTKTRSIASLKSVGADSGLIFRIYFLQIALVSAAATFSGAVLGSLVPMIVGSAAGETLPVPPAAGVYPLPLVSGIVYGLLAAFIFALWPLRQAREIPAARLFRAGAVSVGRPPRSVLVAMGVGAFAIFLIAILQARAPLFAAGFLAAAVAVLFLLAGLARGIVLAARRIPRPRRPLLRLAIANLTRPGGMTMELTVALGLGLTLFAALAIIETNLSRQIEETIPIDAPSHVILDIPSEGVDGFRQIVRDERAAGGLRMVPSLRGAVTALNGVEVSEMENIPEEAWVLRGDRGLTYTGRIPEGNRVTAGGWWDEDHAGEQLVSLEAEMAETLGLAVGDTLTVSVLGMPLQARIANFREVDWRSLGFNFALVFSPGPIEDAPHSYMATVHVPEGGDRALSRAVGTAFPSASIIRIADVIAGAQDILGQLSAAIRAAASVAILAGIAVLIGAVAAARRARSYDAVLLKILGATRGQILAGFLAEFVILSTLVAVLALLLGAAGGWYVVTQIFELEWLPLWGPVVLVVALGALMVVVLSLFGSWAALRTRPAAALRAL